MTTILHYLNWPTLEQEELQTALSISEDTITPISHRNSTDILLTTKKKRQFDLVNVMHPHCNISNYEVLSENNL